HCEPSGNARLSAALINKSNWKAGPLPLGCPTNGQRPDLVPTRSPVVPLWLRSQWRRISCQFPVTCRCRSKLLRLSPLTASCWKRRQPSTLHSTVPRNNRMALVALLVKANLALEDEIDGKRVHEGQRKHENADAPEHERLGRWRRCCLHR